MSSHNPNENIEALNKLLSEEAQQEDNAERDAGSYLATGSQSNLIEREIEYRDVEKHWVRRESWLKTAQRITAEARKVYGRGIRYLTLPAYYRLDVSMYLREDLLEVERAEDGSIKSVYVAAFESDPTKHGRMVGHSPKFRLFGLASIEDALTETTNEYYDDLTRMFPFDIINLDLTTSLTPRHEGPYSRTMQAIDVILRRQADYGSRWALFLTFRNVPSDWEDRTLDQLFSNLQSNLDRYPKVLRAFDVKFHLTQVSKLYDSDPRGCITQAVVKWIIDRANAHNIHLEALNTFHYQRYPEGLPPYTITKLVLEFSRGELFLGVVPTKTTPRQPWMEDDVVACIERNRYLDVEERICHISATYPPIWENIQEDIDNLTTMVE